LSILHLFTRFKIQEMHPYFTFHTNGWLAAFRSSVVDKSKSGSGQFLVRLIAAAKTNNAPRKNSKLLNFLSTHSTYGENLTYY